MVRNIVFITDRGYHIPTQTAIKSLIGSCRTSGCQYNIYCITKGLTVDEKRQIELLEDGKANVFLLDIDSLPTYSADISLKRHVCSANATALTKFDLPVIFPNMDQILYLDGDIIVTDNIDDIFSFDLGESYVAAVKDAGGLYNKEIRKKIVDGIYFNSGVMLLNLKKMREDGIRDILYEEKLSGNDNSLMDQNVYNKILCGRVAVLPIEYNCMYVNLVRARFFRKLQLDSVNRYYGSSYTCWDDIIASAKIIHYAAADKPWKYSDVTAVGLWDEVYDSLVHKSTLKRKKTGLKKIYRLSEYKFMRLPAFLIWELKVLGLKATVYDMKRAFCSYRSEISNLMGCFDE